MKNKRGSILIVTLGFIVVFTLLGVAVMHLAGAQNDVAVKQSFSTEAFWLADGVVERIRNKIMAQADLPAVNTPVVIDSEHFYQNIATKLVPGIFSPMGCCNARNGSWPTSH